MRLRRFFHVVAIIFSSLASMAAHGQTGAETSKQAKKNGNSAASKNAKGSDVRTNSLSTALEGPPTKSLDEALEPPKKLDPAVMAAAVPWSSFSSPSSSEVSNASFPTGYAEQTASAQPAAGQSATDRYPWKRQIVTTTFWIGEHPSKNNPVPNHCSAWDPKWAENYGGTDNPAKESRSDYMPAAFTPRQNPFYVALPYNDVEKNAHKSEASSVIPWFKQEFKQAGKSVLKDRWLAIRYRDKVVYAQWEDCGPFRTDHWQYVFGNDRPKPNLNKGAGLDVSPAVRDYLGMNDTDVTDWKFVDFDEVPTGPWAKVGDNNTFVANRKKTDEQLAKFKVEPHMTLLEIE